MKKLGNEALSLFETLWVQGDNSRLEKLIELKENILQQKTIN